MPLPVYKLNNAVVVKEATETHHTEVENLLLPKLQSVETAADYAAILRMFYGYFSPLEEGIQQQISPKHLPDIWERRKATAILHDLRVTGHSGTGLAICHHLPEIKTTAQAFGAMYVLEGSTLGGKMIAKMLLKNKAFSLSEKAVTFFSGYGEETGKKWKSFLEVFNQQTYSNELVQSANDTFYHLKRWMQHTL